MFARTPLATFVILAAAFAFCGASLDAAERQQQARPASAASQPAARLVRRYQSAPVEVGRTVSESDAQALVNAPISRNYVPDGFYKRHAEPRNFGPTDVGGRGTATGRGISQVPDEPFTNTTLYGGYDSYFTPRGYVGGMGTGGLYGFGYGWGYGPYQAVVGGYGGIGGGPIGFPYGIGSGLYGPRYFAPYWYYPARTGFSVYNPYFYYGNSYYGGYSAPAWTGFGGFGYPYSATAFGGFAYPYAYGVYGYPYYSYLRPTQMYLPTYSYFMNPGMGGLYVPPGYYGFPGYYGYGGYGTPLGSYGYGGAFYW